MRKLSGIIAPIIMIFTQIAGQVAYAAEQRVITLFGANCNTQNAEAQFGFALLDNPGSADSIIAFRYTLKLTPGTGTSVQQIINSLRIEENTNYNIVLPVKEVTPKGTTVEIKLAGGFTDQIGINMAGDLIRFLHPESFSYGIQVESAEIYLANDSSNTNIYSTPNPKENFSYNSSPCFPVTTTTSAPAQAPTTAPRQTHSTSTNTANQSIGIRMDASKEPKDRNASIFEIENNDPGEKIELHALITNAVRVEASWNQTKGTPIVDPKTISNPLPNGNLRSSLTFQVPFVQKAETIEIVLTATDTVKNMTATKTVQIKVNGTPVPDNVAAGILRQDDPPPPPISPSAPAHGAAEVPGAEIPDVAPSSGAPTGAVITQPKTIHKAPLTKSGPAEITLLITLLSIVLSVPARKWLS